MWLPTVCWCWCLRLNIMVHGGLTSGCGFFLLITDGGVFDEINRYVGRYRKCSPLARQVFASHERRRLKVWYIPYSIHSPTSRVFYLPLQSQHTEHRTLSRRHLPALSHMRSTGCLQLWVTCDWQTAEFLLMKVNSKILEFPTLCLNLRLSCSNALA